MSRVQTYIMITVLFSFVAFAEQGSDRRRPTERADVSATYKILADHPLVMGDTLYSFDVQNVTVPSVDTQLGVEFAMGFFWVTGRSSVDNVKNLYQFSRDGQLLAVFPQGTTTLYGWRDLAFDGTYLYASDENEFARIDPTLGTKVGTLPKPAGQTVLRGLAYDPDTRHFWTKDFTGPLIEFDSTGTIINSYSNGLAVYGLAWDRWSSGGPFLWMWSQDGPANGPLCTATQIDPRTGQPTGISFVGVNCRFDSTSDVAGGATITQDIDSMRTTFVGLHQSNPDRVVVYDLGSGGTTAAPDNARQRPSTFSIGNNFPNPFNPSTSIPVSVPFTSRVIVKVYNMLGLEIRTIYSGTLGPGTSWFTWDGRDDVGRQVSTGVYITRLDAGNGIGDVRKMILIK